MKTSKELKNSHAVVLLILLGLLTYSNALGGPFVFDDIPYIVENDWLRSLRNFFDISGVRYIGDLSFALNYAIWGLEPSGFHLVNILIHISNAILLYFLVDSFFKTPFLKKAFSNNEVSPGRYIALASSAIFVTHPLQVQAVTYISQRYTSLAVFFYLLSALLYLKWRSGEGPGKLAYIASVAASLIAMKTKEISFTLPFILAILELCLFKGEGRPAKRLSYILPFFLTALVIPLSLIISSKFSLQEGNRIEHFMAAAKLKEAATLSRYNYLLTQSVVIVSYLKLLFFPYLDIIYNFPLRNSFFDPGVLLSSLAILSMIGIAIYLLVRSARNFNGYGFLLAVGILWFFITISIESSVIPIKDVFNERRVYLPGIGMMLAFTSIVFYLKGLFLKESDSSGKTNVFTAVIIVLTALPLMGLTYGKNSFWNDEIRLYTEDVRKNPYSPSPHMYLGVAYSKRGIWDKTLSEFKTVLVLNPNSVYAHKMLSNLYFNTGLFDDAINECRRITELEPDNAEAHYNLGVLYIKKGLLKEAEGELNSVLKIDAKDEKALKALKYLHGLPSSHLP